MNQKRVKKLKMIKAYTNTCMQTGATFTSEKYAIALK